MPDQSHDRSRFAAMIHRGKRGAQLFGSLVHPLVPRRQHQRDWKPRLFLRPFVVGYEHRVIWHVHHELDVQLRAWWHAHLGTLHVMRCILRVEFGFRPNLRHIVWNH